MDSYTALRQREGTGTGSSTWRVTVRQLESLIRLSEAMAKLECLDEVSVKHVREAKALLNKSIVRVEQPDIDLETEQQEEVTENGHGSFYMFRLLCLFLWSLACNSTPTVRF